MKLGVNMLTWNGSDFIEKALRAVLPYTEDVYVIDTGSTDCTVEILKKLHAEFPKLRYRVQNVQHEGETWTNSVKDFSLTSLLNDMRRNTFTDWILKIDDDEIFPKETMEEIVSVDGAVSVYSIPFLHIEDDKILDPALHTDLQVARLFRNTHDIQWVNPYGREVLAYCGKKVSSRANQPVLCRRLQNYFIHLGDWRRKSRRHDYRFHIKGHCGIPIPEQFRHYVYD